MEIFKKLFRKATEEYRKADKRFKGWLPGGGTASPITAASQQAQRDYDARMRRRIQERDAAPGTPGRYAGSGQVLNALRATTRAGANPIGLALGNKEDVTKLATYYQQNPYEQNEYDLNTNMMLRYLSGTGAEGLRVSPEVGRQIYSDIREQEEKFQDPQYRDAVINQSAVPYIKENLLKGKTGIYYGGTKDAIAPAESLLPTDVGQRWQLARSLGSYWSEPIAGSEGRRIEDRYNFPYAPSSKEGFKGASEGTFFVPTGPANIGRRLVQQGFGTPFGFTMDVQPSGEVNVRAR
jgi:hypothetical protein